MKRDIYIVSDVHGNHEALRKALYKHDLFDNHGLKDPDAFIVQLGDLANCVATSVEDDIECLKMVGNEIDLMLIGNHEIPYFDRSNAFSGFHWNVVIDERLRELNNRQLIWPSFLRGDTLITHAGVTASQLNVIEREGAAEMNMILSDLWDNWQYQHRLFSDIGRARYGPNNVGGVLWCDFDKEFEPTSFPQIVGHTARGLQQKGNALCIDTIRHTGLPTILKLGA